jgi:hypothetical protein
LLLKKKKLWWTFQKKKKTLVKAGKFFLNVATPTISNQAYNIKEQYCVWWIPLQ